MITFVACVALTCPLISGEQRQNRNDINLQINRAKTSLCKNQISEAVNALTLADSFGESKHSLGLYRADIAYRLSDFTEMRKQLKLFFEGDETASRGVSGFNTAEVWHWYLTAKAGDHVKAKVFFDHLVKSEAPSEPGTGRRLDVSRYQTSDVNKMLIFLAVDDMRTGFAHRAKQYLRQSMEVDPTFVLPAWGPKYAEWRSPSSVLDAPIEETTYRFSRFDPSKFDLKNQ